MKYLGLDLGSRTLGLALSDDRGIIANSLTVIRHNEEYDRLILEIEKIVNDYKVEAIVLGLPKNMNNTLGPKGELSLQFQDKLQQKLSIPIFLQDERLTTVSAHKALLESNMSRKKRKTVVDSVAATIILQTFLDKEK